MSREDFSNDKMRHYFANDLSYGTPFGFITVGIICIIVAILIEVYPQSFTSFAGKNSVQSITLYAFLAGVALIIIGAFIARTIYYSVPSDAEYDAWVEKQINEMKNQAMIKLHPDSPQEIQIIPSIVLPGTKAEQKGGYDDNEVRMKKGKDRLWHYSTHDCIILFPAANSIATFKVKISALNQARHALHSTQEYYYHDIVGVTTCTIRETVYVPVKKDKTVPYSYFIDECAFEVSNRSAIEIGAAIGAKRQEKKAPELTMPTLTGGGIDPQVTVDKLRSLIRSKKQSQV